MSADRRAEFRAFANATAAWKSTVTGDPHVVVEHRGAFRILRAPRRSRWRRFISLFSR